VNAFDFRTNVDSLYRVRIEARLLDEEEVDSDDSDDEEETNGDVMDEDGKEDGKRTRRKRASALMPSLFITLAGVLLDRKWISLPISMQISPRPSSPISTRSFLPYVASSSDVSYLLSIQTSTSPLLSSRPPPSARHSLV
jgi:hypothetical protein